MDQMALFATNPRELVLLRVAAAAAQPHHRAREKLERERRVLIQLALWGEPSEIVRWVRRRRKGGPAPKPRPVVASAFDLALVDLRIAVGRGQPDREIRRIVTREDGVTRHVAIREQDTPEWAERERQRRARQRPPRPPKGAKTRSKKLEQLIGEDDGE